MTPDDNATSVSAKAPIASEGPIETLKSEKIQIAIFKENGRQAIELNKLMWQVPLFAITVTGGLWYGAFLSKGDLKSHVMLLSLASLANVTLSLVVVRLRAILEEYLRAIREFAGQPSVASAVDRRFGFVGRVARTRNFVARAFIVMMITSASMSLLVVGMELQKKPTSTAGIDQILNVPTDLNGWRVHSQCIAVGWLRACLVDSLHDALPKHSGS